MKIPEKKILDILEKYNFKGMRKGVNNNIICFCKFHDNHKTPSFSINIKTGLWCCFSGECGLKGNVVSLIRELEGCSYSEAIKILYDGNESAEFLMMIEDLDFSEEVIEEKKPFNIDLYPAELESIPKWKEYLKNINIKFHIAKKVGIKISKNTYYRNKLIIPIFDASRNILDYELRRFHPEDFEKKVLYLPGSRMKELVYGFGLFEEHPKTCLLSEGIKDVLVTFGYGFFCLSLFGTKITPQKINMMLSNNIKKILLCLDNDENQAGQIAQEKIARVLKDYFEVEEIFCPKNKGLNDLNDEEFIKLVKDFPCINEAKLLCK